MNDNGHETLKLNIGSGNVVTMKGYVNVDAKFGDIAYPLKYDDETVDEIYASHILEHFPQVEVINVLKDWVRTLKPGGVLKVAVPDLEWIAKELLSGNPGNLPLAGYLLGGQTDENDFHKAVFNHTTLRLLMEAAGLEDIQLWTSEVKDCASLAVSLNLMGRKPGACPNCGTLDLWTLEGICRGCHPAPDKTAEEWDERSLRFLEGARGVIHIGASKGQERDIYARYDIPAIWVEALPDVYEELMKNIHGYSMQRAYAYLLNAADGIEYDFNVASNDGQSSSIFALADHRKLWPEVEYVGVMKLPSVTFKTMVEQEGINIADYDAMILDVQGAELAVLVGAGDLLDGFKYIRAEAVDFEMYKGGCRLSDLDMYLGSRGFVRVETLKAAGMRGVGQVYDALYERRVAADIPTATGEIIKAENSNGNRKHFVAGEWREEGTGKGQVALEEVKVAPIGLTTSTPRYGSLIAADTMWQVALALRALPARSGGAWWEQGLSRQIEDLLEKGTDRGPIGFIITVDFDSYMTPEDGLQLVRLMYENPHLDCIVPMQVRRGTFTEVLAQTAGPVTITDPLVPIIHGHFGFSIFRARVFERMSHPWMLNVPNSEGRWRDGSTDADIYFWQKFANEGFKAAMATQVVIGHGDEGICWPKLVDGQWVKVWQSVFEWVQTRKPPAGILPESPIVKACISPESPSREAGVRRRADYGDPDDRNCALPLGGRR